MNNLYKFFNKLTKSRALKLPLIALALFAFSTPAIAKEKKLKVNIISPRNGTSVGKKTVNITGKVNINKSTVSIGSTKAKIIRGRFYFKNFPLNDGVNKLTVVAESPEGQKAEEVLTVNVDTTPPGAVTLINPPQGTIWHYTYLRGKTEARATVSIQGGRKNVRVRANSKGYFGAVVLLYRNTEHRLSLQATDRFGNEGPITHHEIITLPWTKVLFVGGVTNGQIYNSNVAPNVTVLWRQYKITSLTLNGAPYINGTEITKSGTYTLEVTAQNFRKRTVTETVSFTIDKDFPVVNITGVKNKSFYSQNVTPIISITDNNPDYYTATLNGQPFTSGTAITAEGEHTLTIKAVDKAGNQTTTTISFIIDKTVPALTITGPAEKRFNVNEITILGTVSDSNFSSLTVNNTPVPVSDSGSFSKKVALSVEGNNTFTIKATDKAGLVKSTVLNIEKDTKAPTFSIITPTDGQITNNKQLLVTGTADSTTVQLKINGVETPVVQGKFSKGLVYAEGKNVITVSATDDLGNTSSKSVTMTLDSILPVLTVTSPENGFKSNKAQINITGTVSEEVKLFINEKAVTVAENKFTYLATLAEGNNNFTIKAVDLGGNKVEKALQIVLDTTAPVVTLTEPEDGHTTAEETVKFTGSVNDINAILKINNQAVALDQGKFNYTYVFPGMNGEWAVPIEVKDELGNTNNYLINVKRDSTAPEITLVSPVDGFKTNENLVNVTGSLDDPDAVLTVNNTVVNFSGLNFTHEFKSLIEGDNAIIIKAVDPYGNENSKSINVILDTIAPEKPVITEAEPDNDNELLLVIKGTAEALTQISITGAPKPFTVKADAEGKFTAPLLLEEDAEYTFIITATDDVNNTSENTLLEYATAAPEILVEGLENNKHYKTDLVPKIYSSSKRLVINSLTLNGVPYTSETKLTEEKDYTLVASGMTTKNETLTKTVKFTIDKTVPLVKYSGFENGQIYSVDTTPQLWAVDTNLDLVVVKLNGVEQFNKITVTEEGLYNLSINAKDKAENEVTEQFSFTIDKTKPLIAITSANQPTKEFETIITGKLTETNLTEFKVNGTVLPLGPDNNFTYTAKLNLEGENIFRFVAKDKGGLETLTEVKIIRDTTGPQVDLSPIAEITKEENITIQGTVDNTLASLTVNGNSVTVENGSFSVPLSLKEGGNLIEVVALDALENKTAHKLTVTLDTEVPSFALITPETDTVTSEEKITISGLLSEKVSLLINNKAVTVSNGLTFTHQVTLAEGENLFTLKATDAALNEKSLSLKYSKDTVAPVLSVSSPAENFVTKAATVSVTGTVDDQTARVTINGTEIQLNEQMAFTKELNLPEQSGSLEINIVATDKVGNKSTAKRTVTRDITPPIAKILTPQSNFMTADETVKIIGEIDDSKATVKVNNVAAVVANGRFEIAAFPLNEGDNILTVTAVDEVENSSTSDPITVKRDNTPPGPVTLTNPPAYVKVDRIVISGQAEKESSLTITGGKLPVTQTIAESGNFTATIFLNTNQETNLTFVLTDSLGNKSETITHKVISDTVKPLIALTAPLEDSEYTSSKILVSGKITDSNLASTVKVNGVETPLNADGVFTKELSFENGPASVKIESSDLAENNSEKTVNFTVNDKGDMEGPQIIVLSPAKNSSVKDAQVNLVFAITDQSEIASLTVNGVNVGLQNIVNGKVSVDTQLDPQNKITIVAADEHNQTTTVIHDLILDNTPPEAPLINLISPASPSNQSKIKIYGTAEKDSVITVKGGTKESLLTVAESGFTIEVELKPNETNNLVITAVDQAGNESAPVNKEIIHDDIKPAVTNTLPAKDAIGVAVNTNITVTFSELLKAESITGITLKQANANVAFTKNFNETTKVLTITPSADLADAKTFTLTIPKTLTDLALNELATAHILSFSTIDSIAPEKPILDPLPSSSKVKEVTISGTAEEGSTVKISGASAPVQTITNAQKKFTANIVLNENALNNLSVTAVDKSLNESPAATISISHDSVAPTILSSLPQNNSINAGVKTDITVSFSEAIKNTDIAKITLKRSGNTVPVQVSLSADAKSVSIAPTDDLSQNTRYILTIPSTLEDLAGNKIASEELITFTTTSSKPIIYDSNPKNLTNLESVQINGFATPGTTLKSKITIGANVTETDHGIMPPTGLFDVQISLVQNQENSITFVSVDSENVESTPSSPVIIVQDNKAPEVSASLPVNNGELTSTGLIYLQFNEPVDRDTISETSVRLKDELNNQVSAKLALSASGKSLNIFPQFPLTLGKSYSLVADNNIKDLAGNSLKENYAVSFTIKEEEFKEKPAAPKLTEQPPAVTDQDKIVLKGLAEPGTQLHVEGGELPLLINIGESGEFLAQVTLFHDVRNSIVLYVEKDGVYSDVLTVSIAHQSLPAGIRILSPQESLTYNGKSLTVFGIIDDPDNVGDIFVEGEKAAKISNYFARQFIFENQGAQTLTVTAQLKDGNEVTKTVDVTYTPDEEGNDTNPPIVKIVFPQDDFVSSSPFIEMIGTVEEGTGLHSIIHNNSHADQVAGNIFFITAELQPDTENILTVTAQDKAGYEGKDSVSVFLDDTVPAVPEIDEFPTLVKESILRISGRGEPGSLVTVQGGLVTVRVRVADNGRFTVVVPLNENTANTLTIVSSDEAGNTSSAKKITVNHDNQAPTVVKTIPSNESTGVLIDAPISITFSEPIDFSTVSLEKETAGGALVPGTVSISNSEGNLIAGSFSQSADGKTIHFKPTYRFQKGDLISVSIFDGIKDLNSYNLASNYLFSFETALYETTFSGVVVDSNLKPIPGVKVGILNTDIEQQTTIYGTFLLDNIPTGEQTIYVNGIRTTEEINNSSDKRRFGMLEFVVNVVKDVDNSLGRPIFLVPTDELTRKRLNAPQNTLSITENDHALKGFSISFANDEFSWLDSKDTPSITATAIPSEYIPDRLPNGAIPHFMVEIGPDNLEFNAPVDLTFPNAYELAEGDKVKIFYFHYGIHNYMELGEAAVQNNSISATVNLPGAGFLGIIPADASFDLSKTYLRGKVVDSNGNGIVGVKVNAIAGNTIAITGKDGTYTIPLPEVRIFKISTYATISTNLGADPEGSPILVFKSPVTDLAASGITDIPDIVVDTFFIGGNLTFLSEEGDIIQRASEPVFQNGVLTQIDESLLTQVKILIFRQEERNGQTVWSTTPYVQSKAYNRNSGKPVKNGFDAAFSIPVIANFDNDNQSESSLKPGEIIKIVAFDPTNGHYGEKTFKIPQLSQNTDGEVSLDVTTDLRLYPPRMEIDMNRVFFVNGIKRRDYIPYKGVVFTSDDFVEVKTRWTTREATPVECPEISLPGKLKVISIGYETDTYFTVKGGQASRILELRSLYPRRLDVLERETDVGTEEFTISADGSFADNSNFPLTVTGRNYDVEPVSKDENQNAIRKALYYVTELNLEPIGDGTSEFIGRALPGSLITLGGNTFTANEDGFFTGLVQGGELGFKINDSAAATVGATFTPVMSQILPSTGSQGEIITLHGEHFSLIAAENKVKFNGSPADVVSSTSSQIRVRVPDAATTGDVTVTVANKVSNGLPFTFISRGLVPNGSFEKGDTRGFSTSGNVFVISKLGKLFKPTHKTTVNGFMLYMNTSTNPVNGTAEITSGKFIKPANTNFLSFDLAFAGTNLFAADINDYTEFYIIPEGQGQQIKVQVAPQNFTSLANVSSYDKGSLFRTYKVDLSAFNANTPLQFKVVLKGRGALPQDYLDQLPEVHYSVLNLLKAQGTGLLLDNFMLHGSSALAAKPNQALISTVAAAGSVTVSTTFTEVDQNKTFAIEPNSTLYLVNMANGERYETLANENGEASLIVPVGTSPTPFALYYTTPKTTQDSSSDRLISETLLLNLQGE